jgi:hypothetical protein
LISGMKDLAEFGRRPSETAQHNYEFATECITAEDLNTSGLEQPPNSHLRYKQPFGVKSAVYGSPDHTSRNSHQKMKSDFLSDVF